MKRLLFSIIGVSLALVSCVKTEQSDSFSAIDNALFVDQTKTEFGNIVFHEETGLLLQRQEDPYRVSDESEATHAAIAFFPKNTVEYLFINNLSSEGISISFLPFGYTPVNQVSGAEERRYTDYPRENKYSMSIHSMSNSRQIGETCFDGEVPEASSLPVLYVLWPLEKEIPTGIDYERRYWVNIPKKRIDPIQQISLPIKIDTYDTKLNTYVPMEKIKVRFSRGSYSADFYTTANGTVDIRPFSLAVDFTLSELEQFNISIIYETPKFVVSRDDNTSPIQKSLGTVYSIWGSMNYGFYPTYTTHQTSSTTECETFRAAKYYFYGNHAFSDLRLTAENGRLIHVYTPVNNGSYAATYTYPNDVPTIYVYNNPAYSADNDCIGSVIHELGLVHHYYLKGGYSQFLSVADILKESFASYVGWSVGEQYYTSKGYSLSEGEHLNWQHRQNWVPHSSVPYSPIFVDLTDDYNQPALTDTISGVPATVIDDMGAQCTTVLQCKTHMSDYVGTYLTLSDLNLYFSYYL